MADDPIEVCARADAAFVGVLYRALGIAVEEHDGFWLAERPGSPVFQTGGTVARAASSGAVLAALEGREDRLEVRDAWASLDLTAGGLRSEPDDVWMIRAPGPPPAVDVPGLDIRRAVTAADVLAFERATLAVAGAVPAGHHDGAIHPAEPTAALADLHLFTGYLGDRPVGTSLAAVSPDAVAISAVNTAAPVRRRGIGAAMTAAAVAVAPDRPATLAATELGRAVYLRLGFRELPRGLRWTRP